METRAITAVNDDVLAALRPRWCRSFLRGWGMEGLSVYSFLLISPFFHNPCAKGCKRITLTLHHCGCQATCQNRLMHVTVIVRMHVCIWGRCFASVVCVCVRSLRLEVNCEIMFPNVHACILCVHTCICVPLPVYTTVLAQGPARWHCARFKCVLISPSFLLLRLMPVFCWSVYPVLSRLSHTTCFLLVTFIPKCQHQLIVVCVW